MFFILHPSVIVAGLLFPVASQTLGVPSEWRKPNITISLEERAALADGVLENSIPMLDGNLTDSVRGSSAATMYLQSLLADIYIINGQESYKDMAMKFFSQYDDYLTLIDTMNTNGDYIAPHGHMIFAYAAIRAYMAYKSDFLLRIAEYGWDVGRNFTVLDEDDFSSDAVNIFNGKPQLSCQGKSMVGGTSNINNPAFFSGMSSGLFMSLSAYMYQASFDQKYLNSAIKSANFIQDHLIRPPGIIVRLISHQDCTITPNTLPSASGYYIEGLSVLYGATQNASMLPMIQQAIVAQTTQTGRWQQADGVQIKLDCIESGDIARGLRRAYEQLNSSRDLHSYIESYLGVQYNALLDLASTNGSGFYALPWTGPATLSPALCKQTAAAEVLLAGVYPIERNTTSATSPPLPSPSMQPGASTSPVGTIVGGILGGIALIAAIWLLFVFYRRRYRQKAPSLTPFSLGPVNEEQPLQNDSTGAKYREAFPSTSATSTSAMPDASAQLLQEIVRIVRAHEVSPPSYRPPQSISGAT